MGVYMEFLYVDMGVNVGRGQAVTVGPERWDKRGFKGGGGKGNKTHVI